MTDMAVIAGDGACAPLRENGGWRLSLMQRHGVWLDLFYGIEVQNGWQAIVTEMMDEIARILRRAPDGQGFRVTRLGEVDGCLVVQVLDMPQGAAADLSRVIAKARERAQITCEICGELHENHRARGDRAICWSL